MIASYLLSSTLVPVFSTWLMKEAHRGEEREGLFGGLRSLLFDGIWNFVLRFRWPLVLGYLGASIGLHLHSGAAHGNGDLPRSPTRRVFGIRLARSGRERGWRRPSASSFGRST